MVVVQSKTTPDKIYEVENTAFRLMESDDTEYMSWGIVAMGLGKVLTQANAASKGGNVKVAVIDTGVNVGSVSEPGTFRYYFPETKLEVYDVASGLATDAAVADFNSHGTHVAGTIAEGLPAEATLLVIRAAAAGYSGRDLYLDSVLSAIDYAVEHGADIINMSFGTNEYIEVLDDYLKAASQEKVISVAASGNEGKNSVMYPANFDEVIAVGSVNVSLNRAANSNYGAGLDFVAPGVNINGINGVKSGTSMATPHMAAVIGLMKSYNESLGVGAMRNLLAAHTRDLGATGRDVEYGYGITDFAGATMCKTGLRCDEYGVFALGNDDSDSESAMIEVVDKTGGVANVSRDGAKLSVMSDVACIVIVEKDDGGLEPLKASVDEGLARRFEIISDEKNSTEITNEIEIKNDVRKVYVILKGDMNMNGKVNVNDSALINLSLLVPSNKFYRELSDMEKLIADVNGNGKINVNDSAMINLSLLPISNRFYTALGW